MSLRFSYRSWDKVPFACVQELREAIGKFRESAGEVAKDGEWGGKRRKFTIAVADTFGEGGPVSGKQFGWATLWAMPCHAMPRLSFVSVTSSPYWSCCSMWEMTRLRSWFLFCLHMARLWGNTFLLPFSRRSSCSSRVSSVSTASLPNSSFSEDFSISMESSLKYSLERWDRGIIFLWMLPAHTVLVDSFVACTHRRKTPLFSS